MAISSAVQAAGIGAAASIGGGLLTARMARKESARNRKFQERMSSTAYQRSMADMRKAGLNPMLAYQQGGASSPAGSMASVPDMGGAASTAIQAALGRANLELIDANTALTQAKTSVIKPATAVGDAVGDALGGVINSAKTAAGYGPGGNRDILHSLKMLLMGANPVQVDQYKSTKDLQRGKSGKLEGGKTIKRGARKR